MEAKTVLVDFGGRLGAIKLAVGASADIIRLDPCPSEKMTRFSLSEASTRAERARSPRSVYLFTSL